jgi:hypothetical protein
MKKAKSYPQFKQDEIDERKTPIFALTLLKESLDQKDVNIEMEIMEMKVVHKDSFDSEREDHDEDLKTLDSFRRKDQNRTERLARLGSSSSRVPVVIEPKCCTRCGRIMIRLMNYFLERGEEEQQRDREIYQKSYSGFYYFIKWFIRAVFILAFTISGNILGKELWCQIKYHDYCDNNVFDLWSETPHIIASILGSVIGLLIGQSLGRLLWDKSTDYIQKLLRACEKKADESKCFLFSLCVLIYILGTVIFTLVFWEFVDLIDNKTYNMLIGTASGGFVGILLAFYAFKKHRPCISGEFTPKLEPLESPTQSSVDVVMNV